MLVLFALGALGMILSMPGAADARGPSPELDWHSFIGGEGFDVVTGVVPDENGNLFVVGYSDVSWGNPARPHSSTEENVKYDIYVAKLRTDGTLAWNTFLGGAENDHSGSIILDDSGKILITGYSESAWGQPVDPYASDKEIIVAKLAANGNLLWHSFFGGSGVDQGSSVVQTDNGDIYVGGFSNASWGTPLQPYSNGGDAVLLKLHPSGALAWNTFVGGSGLDIGSIETDGSNLFVAGFSDVTWGAPKRAFTGMRDAFAAKLNANGTLKWNTFLGGNAVEEGGIVVEPSGSSYVVGRSTASWGTPLNPYTASLQDTFVARLDRNGRLAWHTFVGGTGIDYARGAAVDSLSNVYLAGDSTGSWGSPILPFSSGTDAFATRINSNTASEWNTFLGGAGAQYSTSVALDEDGSLFVTGYSDSDWGTPVRGYTNWTDGFIAKISNAAPAPSCSDKPAVPELKSPAHNLTTTDTTPQFKWWSAECAEDYTVVIKNQATKQNYGAQQLEKLKYKPEPLQPGFTYKWYVKACNMYGCASSAKRTLKIQ
jgi:hypothetical protein